MALRSFSPGCEDITDCSSFPRLPSGARRAWGDCGMSAEYGKERSKCSRRQRKPVGKRSGSDVCPGGLLPLLTVREIPPKQTGAISSVPRC